MLGISIQFITNNDKNLVVQTRVSEGRKLKVIEHNDMIPINIQINPIDHILDLNLLKESKNFKVSILNIYYYQLQNTNTTYHFTKPETKLSKNILNLKNNASSMFANNISFNDLNSVQQVVNGTYKIKFLTSLPIKSLNTTISIPFSSLYNQL